MESAGAASQTHWFHSRDPEHTRRLGVALGRVLRDEAGAGRGAVVALLGDLGAGKTLFVKGLAEGLGIDPALVSSPTFVLASQYLAADGLRLEHVDFYRLADHDELEAIGFFDLLEPGAVVAVEWADRFPEALPGDRLEVALRRPVAAVPAAGATERELRASAHGEQSAVLLAAWRRRAGDAPGDSS